MVNPEIINDRLQEMIENITLLEELKDIPFDAFSKDPKIFKLAQYCLQLSIQCLLDICHYCIADSNWQRPKDNKEAIVIMSRNDVLPTDFAEQILPMAGLRNILVHEYFKIDLKTIYTHIQNLQDLRSFQKYIVEYLSNIK